MAHLILERVSKVFATPGHAPVQALREASLAVDSDELTALLGPSGCGKTTLLRVIAGFERPDSGTLSLDGRDLLSLAARDREVAMVFQQPALYPHLTARDNLLFGLRLRKVDPKEIRLRVNEVADLLEINDCLDRLPQALSGGQRQRLALGRAIVRRPRLYLLDEPLSQLDAPMRLQLRQDLRRIQRELGATMILVTHDQADAFAIADRVAVMLDGAILQCDRPPEVYQHPAGIGVARVIGNPPMNLVPVVLEIQSGGPCLNLVGSDAGVQISQFGLHPPGGRLRLHLPEAHTIGGMAPYVGREIMLGIRPESIRVSAVSPSPGSRPPAVNLRIEALVLRSDYAGAETNLYVSVGSAQLVARVPSSPGFSQGQQVVLSWSLADSRMFDMATGRLLAA